MANLVTQTFRSNLLAAYFSGGAVPTTFKIRLFKDSANIIEGTSIASLLTVADGGVVPDNTPVADQFQQTGGGYAPKTITPVDYTVEAGVGGIRVRLEDQTWTTTADDWGTLRWAVITTVVGATETILLAKDYGTGKTVTGVGANVTVDDLFFQIND
jgi:hypothetical protein